MKYLVLVLHFQVMFICEQYLCNEISKCVSRIILFDVCSKTIHKVVGWC